MKVQAVLPKVSSDDKHEIKEVKTTLNLYEKLAKQNQKEQNEELDDSLSCAVLQACSGPSTCTIIDRGNGYKQKMVIIKWMFFFLKGVDYRVGGDVGT